MKNSNYVEALITIVEKFQIRNPYILSILFYTGFFKFK